MPFHGYRRVLGGGLLRKDGAIDVPAAWAAGFEKFFVFASKLAGFHDVDGKDEGTGDNRQHFS
jgi:hypothetical protein